MIRHRRRVIDDLGGMQKRLRRDAANIQADTAQDRVAFDENDLQAQVGGAKCGRVTAGSGANDDELRFVVRVSFCLRRCPGLRSGPGQDIRFFVGLDDDGFIGCVGHRHDE